MSNKEDEELERVHLLLYKRDNEMINLLVSKHSDKSKFVRKIVRNYLDKLRERAKEKEMRNGEE